MSSSSSWAINCSVLAGRVAQGAPNAKRVRLTFAPFLQTGWPRNGLGWKFVELENFFKGLISLQFYLREIVTYFTTDFPLYYRSFPSTSPKQTPTICWFSVSICRISAMSLICCGSSNVLVNIRNLFAFCSSSWIIKGEPVSPSLPLPSVHNMWAKLYIFNTAEWLAGERINIPVLPHGESLFTELNKMRRGGGGGVYRELEWLLITVLVAHIKFITILLRYWTRSLTLATPAAWSRRRGGSGTRRGLAWLYPLTTTWRDAPVFYWAQLLAIISVYIRSAITLWFCVVSAFLFICCFRDVFQRPFSESHERVLSLTPSSLDKC